MASEVDDGGVEAWLVTAAGGVALAVSVAVLGELADGVLVAGAGAADATEDSAVELGAEALAVDELGVEVLAVEELVADADSVFNGVEAGADFAVAATLLEDVLPDLVRSGGALEALALLWVGGAVAGPASAILTGLWRASGVAAVGATSAGAAVLAAGAGCASLAVFTAAGSAISASLYL